MLIVRLIAGIAAVACFVLAASVWGAVSGSLVVGILVSTLMWTLRATTSPSRLMRVLRFLIGPGVVGFFTVILIGGGAPWWQAPLMLLATQMIGPALARVSLTKPVPPPTAEELAAAAELAARTRTPGIFGAPGGVGTTSTFGVAGAIGAQGEHRTAVLLDRLADDGSTSVYHGLRFPGSTNADVDHAVVRGPGVVLVDSKLYASGIWGLAASAEPGKVVLVSSTGTRHENSMPAATAGFSQLVAPGQGRVAAVIVLHGHASTRVDPDRAYHSGVHLCTAADLEANVEHLLSAMGGPRGASSVYPGVLHAMHTQLKTGVVS